MLGDTLVETTYSDYRDFGGVMFPGHIVRTQGGHPVLDITVSEVKLNPAVDLPVPDQVKQLHAASGPGQRAEARRRRLLPDGRERAHASPSIRATTSWRSKRRPTRRAPQAVIAKIKETIPNKPIRYVINSHVHFDHSGGLRTYVDEGATVVTHQMNRPYFEQAWAAPRTLNPDRLAQVEEGGQVRDGHRQARADGQEPEHRDSLDREQRTQ